MSDSGQGTEPAEGEPRRRTAHGPLILVLGIIGLAFPVIAPIVWWFANQTLRVIASHREMASQRSLVVAGRILGIVGTTVLIALIVLGLISGAADS